MRKLSQSGELNEDLMIFPAIYNIDLINIQNQALFFSLAIDMCIDVLDELSDAIIIVFALSDSERSKDVYQNLWNF